MQRGADRKSAVQVRKGSLNNWAAQTYINVQPYKSFKEYNSVPRTRFSNLKMCF